MRERHSALLLNIGTYAKEEEAHKLLNNLSMSLPFVVMVTCLLDSLLAAVYLKLFHPWRIILQEVRSCAQIEFLFLLLINPFLGTRLMGTRGRGGKDC